ncbi:MAG: hypothetical protein WBO74_17510, partial [Thermoanaerobaculia bacterium]
MNETKTKEYKSPRRKLVKFFEKSRDQWKTKCIDAKAMVKKLKNRIRYLEANKNEWKSKAIELEKELARIKALESRESGQEVKKNGEVTETALCADIFAQVPRHHTYSIGHIWLFVTLVLSSAATLRSSSRTLELVLAFFGYSSACPSWYAGRFWLLRLGYYKLMKPKEQADDWVWIIDHTVQLGVEKCLLILGVRLSHLASDLTLKQENVEPIALYPVRSSNGDVVFQQLEETIEKTGLPRAIVADQGSDLKSGIEAFIQAHPTTSYLYDIKHKTAALLKQHLQNDETWKRFTQLAAQSKSQVQQTAMAFLAPPNQRTKARYMNLEVLVRWSQRALVLLDQIEKRTDTRESHEKIKTKLGWLTEFREPIKEWDALCQSAITAERFVRKQGLWNGCELELAQCFDPSVQAPKALQFREQLLDFVKNESLKAQPNERLLGSSEIIESVLGKTKRLEQDQSKSGFTGLVLGAAAIVSHTTQEVVTKAMETVPTRKVIE